MECCSRCGRESTEELAPQYNAKLCDYCFNALLYRLETNRIKYDNKLRNSNHKITKRFIKDHNIEAIGAIVFIFLLCITLLILYNI